MSQQWDPELLIGFFEESREDLEQLESELVALRADPSNAATIQKAFRVIHSIKGNSGFFGVKNTSAFCNEFENLLDGLRADMSAVTADIVELLLAGLDEIKLMLDLAEDGERTSDLTPTQLQILDRVAQEGAGSPVEVPVRLIKRIAEATAAAEFESLAQREELAATLREMINELATATGVAAQDAGAGANTTTGVPRSLPGQWNDVDVAASLKSLDDWLRAGEGEQEQPLPQNALDELEGASEADSCGAAIFDEFVNDAKILAEAQLMTDPVLVSALREKFDAFVSHLRGMQSSEDERQAPVVEASEKETQSKPAAAKASAERKTFLRVDQRSIDGFLAHIGDLILICKNYSVLGRRIEEITGTESCALEMKAVNQRFEATSRRLQRSVLSLRKVAAGTMMRTVPRMVTELADKLKKQVSVELIGEDVEVDRSTLDLLKDPLTHILRNSLDHGLETPEERIAQGKPPLGVIRLIASSDKQFFSLTIEDDGRGINVDRVREKAIENGTITAQQAAAMNHEALCALIFTAGLSTAATRTDVSGRGVGMDVVMGNVSEAAGQVTVDSTAGAGTTVRIRIPVTGTIMVAGALMVEIAGCEYFIPTSDIQTLVRPDECRPHQLPNGTEIARVRGRIHPFLQLEDLLPRKDSENMELDPHWVVIGKGEKTACVAIDQPLGMEQIVIMDLDEMLPDLKIISGAALTGAGRVALVLNTKTLVANAGIVPTGSSRARESELAAAT